MDLKSFLHSMPVPDREAFAVRCGTSYGHLRNVAYGKPCAEKLAINIDRESGGVVTCESLCPDVDFGYLRGTPGAAPEVGSARSKPCPLPAYGEGAKHGSPTAEPASTAAEAASAEYACQADARKTATGEFQEVV